jgi:hypothetical protein
MLLLAEAWPFVRSVIGIAVMSTCSVTPSFAANCRSALLRPCANDTQLDSRRSQENQRQRCHETMVSLEVLQAPDLEAITGESPLRGA